MILKFQDILFLLKLITLGKTSRSYNMLTVELGMSPPEVHAAANRALAAKLAVKDNDLIQANIRNLDDFLLHGIQYVFVVEHGELVRGLPTAYAAAPKAAKNDPTLYELLVLIDNIRDSRTRERSFASKGLKQYG